MSAKSVENVLSRAMSDKSFADALFSNPDQALAGYELTAEEKANLKGMDRTAVGKYAAAAPEERKSMALSLNHNESTLRSA